MAHVPGTFRTGPGSGGSRFSTFAAAAACSWLLLTLPACATFGYYVGAARGQLALQERSRPISDILGDPATPEALKARLAAATRIREFASRELSLPEGKGFRSYADLGRPFAVWNVLAAPEFSLEPREWCFPFAGCVSYRGYFSETEARAFAATLSAAGDDVYVGGAAAYSTLGWFDDPLLSTFLRYPDAALAGLLFHELAHRVAYARDDTAFNESFATAVEREGVKRWLAAEGTADQRADWEASGRRDADVLGLLDHCRRRLAEVYGSGSSDEEKRAAKARAFGELAAEYEALKASWGGHGGYDAWFASDLNNAKLASAAAYSDLVPDFLALLGQLGGDLPLFYGRVGALAALPGGQRLARLRDEAGLPAAESVRADRREGVAR